MLGASSASDDRDRIFVENSGRNELKLVGFVTYDDGVSGVVSAAKTNDQFGLPAQNIDKLSFSLVSPLSSDNYKS